MWRLAAAWLGDKFLPRRGPAECRWRKRAAPECPKGWNATPHPALEPTDQPHSFSFNHSKSIQGKTAFLPFPVNNPSLRLHSHLTTPSSPRESIRPSFVLLAKITLPPPFLPRTDHATELPHNQSNNSACETRPHYGGPAPEPCTVTLKSVNRNGNHGNPTHLQTASFRNGRGSPQTPQPQQHCKLAKSPTFMTSCGACKQLELPLPPQFTLKHLVNFKMTTRTSRY